MAGSLNKVQLIGHLGKDPDIRSLNSGDKVANFRMATSESWKDKNSGERQERTEWHSIVIFGPLAEVAGKYLKKGSKVYVEGQIQTRKWQDQGGNDRYSTEVVLRGFGAQLIMLDGKGDGSGDRGRSEAGYEDEERRRPANTSSKTYAEDLDDEIPF